MEIVRTECFHGIPLVNGKGCIVCSNKERGSKVFVSFAKGNRITQEMRKLSALGTDKVEEVPVEQFI